VTEKKDKVRWRSPWALAALLRRSRKARNKAKYTRKAKHKKKENA
jgi:hypothetical protein